MNVKRPHRKSSTQMKRLNASMFVLVVLQQRPIEKIFIFAIASLSLFFSFLEFFSTFFSLDLLFLFFDVDVLVDVVEAINNEVLR